MMAIFDRPSIGHSVVKSMTLVVLGLFLKVFVVRCTVRCSVRDWQAWQARVPFFDACALLVTPYTSA